MRATRVTAVIEPAGNAERLLGQAGATPQGADEAAISAQPHQPLLARPWGWGIEQREDCGPIAQKKVSGVRKPWMWSSQAVYFDLSFVSVMREFPTTDRSSRYQKCDSRDQDCSRRKKVLLSQPPFSTGAIGSSAHWGYCVRINRLTSVASMSVI